MLNKNHNIYLFSVTLLFKYAGFFVALNTFKGALTIVTIVY